MPLFKKKYVQVLIAAILSLDVLAVGVIRFVPDVTIYEYLCMGVLAVVITWKLLIPIGKGTLDRYAWLKCIVWISAVVAVYSTITYGQTLIDSDYATASLLAKSQMKNHSLFPATWNYANGEIWGFSINLFVMPFCAFMKNQVLARLLGSALIVVTAMVLVWWMHRELEGCSYLIAIPVLFVFLRGASDMILYQAAYTSPLIYLVAAPMLFYRAELKNDKMNRKYTILSGICLFVSCISGSRNLAEIILPLWAGCLFMLYLDIRKQEHPEWKQICRKIIQVSLQVFVPASMGYGCYKWLCSWHIVNDSTHNATVFVDSMDEVVRNFGNLIVNFFKTFGYIGGQGVLTEGGICNVVSVCMCVICIFIVPVLQGRKIKQENRFVQFYYWFSMVHNVILVFCIVFLGKQELRYLFTTVFTLVIISSHYIMKYWIGQMNFRKNIWVGLFVIAALFENICLANYSVNWTESLDEKRKLVDILKQEGLTKGYASYWNAYGNQLYSNLDITFGGVSITTQIIPSDWLVDSEVYQASADRTFLLIADDEDEKNPLLNKQELLQEKISNIADDEIHTYKYTIYIFDYDIQGRLQFDD